LKELAVTVVNIQYTFFKPYHVVSLSFKYSRTLAKIHINFEITTMGKVWSTLNMNANTLSDTYFDTYSGLLYNSNAIMIVTTTLGKFKLFSSHT